MNKLLWRRSHSSLFLYISLFCVPVNRFLNRLCLLLFQQPADLFCRRVDFAYRRVMIQGIDDRGQEFGHVRFRIVGLFQKLRVSMIVARNLVMSASV